MQTDQNSSYFGPSFEPKQKAAVGFQNPSLRSKEGFGPYPPRREFWPRSVGSKLSLEEWAAAGPAYRTNFKKTVKANKTGYLGVKYNKRSNNYSAYIRSKCGLHKIYCGSSKSPSIAARLYDEMAKKIYGAEAVINGGEQ